MKQSTYFGMTIALVLLVGCNRADRIPQSPHTTASPSPSPSPSPTPSAATTEIKWKTVTEFDYTWKENQPALHFKLELPEGYKDPGDFTRIRIQAPGRPEFLLDNEDGWIPYNYKEPRSGIYNRLREQNLVSSEYVLVLPGSAQKGDPPLLLLHSWGYASDPERLHVIGFQPTGQPIVLFNDELDLVDLIDLDGDGYPEIVGRPCFSQGFGDGLLTYDPLHVYSVPHPVTSTATLSLPLSEAYNLKHYYGWAGPDCSEKLAVVLHPPSGGKPIIMKTDEAEKLMAGTKERKK